MASSPVQWRLFVDESGNFADSDQTVATAGILIRLGTPGSSPLALRTALQRAAPTMAWPLHASVLNRPVAVAIGYDADSGVPAPAGDSSNPSFAQTAGAVFALLQRAAPADLQHVATALSGRQRLDWQRLRKLDELVKEQAPLLYATLELSVRATWLRLRQVLAQFAAGAPTESPVVSIFACSETQLADATGTQGDLDASRYLELLEGLLQRVADLLAQHRGSHEVRLWILSRPMLMDVNGKRVSLRYADVERIAQRVTPADGSIQMQMEQIAFFGPRVHPALVLSDLIANRLRPQLVRPGRRLGAVELGINAVLGISPRSGNPALSHVSASGWGARSIAAARNGDSPPAEPPQPPPLKRWACEQAAEWAAALRRQP